jgi:hypothetical protein
MTAQSLGRVVMSPVISALSQTELAKLLFDNKEL